MRIALLIGHFPPGAFGGAEIQAESWARHLADAHQVTVITRRDPPSQAEHEERDGFRVIRLPVSRVPVWRTITDVGGIVAAVGRLQPKPDVLLCFQTFVSGLAGVRAQDALGIPAIVWIRGESEYRLRESPLHARISPGVWNSAAAVLVQSEENRVELLKELERVAAASVPGVRAKLDVVPNGLDLPEGPFGPGERVLTVGRLIADKGMDTVIDACAVAGRPLTVAGEGPERAMLEARARDRGVPARFEGYVGREQLGALYRDAAAVVLAARRGEGLPNVVLEAMAYARPIVATPVAGTRDLVVDGVSGLLVPPDDPTALAEALLRLDRDPEFGRKLGGAARLAAERFGWAAIRPRLEAVLARRMRA